MLYLEPPPQAGALLQLQLTSFMGGNNMLEATPDDASYGCFAAEADDAFGTSTQSNRRSPPQIIQPSFCATFQGSLMVGNGHSPQPSPEPSFTSGLGRTESPSDWPQQQTSAANNDSLIFSSPIERYNPGQNHRPHSAVQTQMTVYDAPQLPYERGDDELQHGFQYSDKRHDPLYSEDPIPAQLFRNGFPNIPINLPYNHLGQPQASSIGQPNSRTRSGHSSNGSTPIVTCSGVEDMVPDILNSANDAREVLYSVGSSGFCLSNDIQPSSNFETSNFETSNSYHSPKTESSFTHSSFEPTDNHDRVSSTKSLRNRHPAASHHSTFENTIQHLPLQRSLSARSFNRRSSIGQTPLQPKPQQNVTEGTRKKSFIGREVTMPRKGRGRRTKPLEDKKRKAATKRRNERTVCIGCKLAKVICEGREHGRNCDRCTSTHNNAPKPFVCVPASFIELIQQGSTMLLALHTIYSGASNAFRQAISLPSSIDVRQLLGSISTLQRPYGVIRAYEGASMLLELDLQACWTFINSNCSPTSHPFHQFIDGLKIQRQGNWKACIRNGTNPLASLCKTLFAWDDAAPYATYSMVYEISHGIEDCLDLDPSNEQHKQLIVVAAQLYRIIGRQLELQFYDYLKKALGNPNICREVVLNVGRAIISLRRRLASWTQRWDKNQSWDNAPFPSEIESYTDKENDGYSSWDGSIVADRVKNLCLILYVYFCYMRRRLPTEEQKGLHIMEVRDPDNERMVKERLPQYESIKGFEDWLQFID
ncbi:hypothetical protein GGI43DRAFT_382417 [Trichoderma evansii]